MQLSISLSGGGWGGRAGGGWGGTCRGRWGGRAGGGGGDVPGAPPPDPHPSLSRGGPRARANERVGPARLSRVRAGGGSDPFDLPRRRTLTPPSPAPDRGRGRTNGLAPARLSECGRRRVGIPRPAPPPDPHPSLSRAGPRARRTGGSAPSRLSRVRAGGGFRSFRPVPPPDPHPSLSRGRTAGEGERTGWPPRASPE